MQDNQLSVNEMDAAITEWSFSGSPRQARKTLETLKQWGLPKHLAMPLVEYALENAEAWSLDSALKDEFSKIVDEFKEYKRSLVMED